MKSVVGLAVMGCLAASFAFAAGKPAAEESILPGGNSKAPISVEADKLVYFEKELKATYSGNVVAIQGDSKLTCSTLTIYMEKSAPAGGPAPAKTPEAGGAPGATPQSSKMRHMDCAGPVTMVSKTQTATGDSGAYDKPSNTVTLDGHVTLSDGHNVTKGDKLVYDLNTGQATVGGGHGRTTGLFIPGSADNAPKSKTP
jgi:lipopolysaccharide export system protein LptA